MKTLMRAPQSHLIVVCMPETADFIATKSGGSKFETADLATPQINIAYGAWYLAYLLRRYDGDVKTTLAAYNAGEGKVDQWLAASGKPNGSIDSVNEIPYAETRGYVTEVLKAKRDYRREYPRELARSESMMR